MKSTPFTLEVWGEFACFTRPEAKVERLSYPVITPSAARGIFDAIYCNRHQMWWQISRIEVLKPPKFIALRRNEVKGRAPAASTISGWMRGTSIPQPLMADSDDEATGRTQRQTIALKDVRYRITAEIRAWPNYEAKLAEFHDKFRRKAKAGQCLYQPYFGCREFPAYFELTEEASDAPIDLDLKIGWMVYDVFQLDRPGTNMDDPAVSLFEACVENGVLKVPEYNSPDVRKPRANHA